MLPWLRASNMRFTSSAAILSFAFLLALVVAIACLQVCVPVHALLRGDEGAPEWSSSSISTLELGARERKASSRRPSLLGDLFSLYNHKRLKSSTLFRAAITHSPSSAPSNATVCKKCREDGPSCTLDSQSPGYPGIAWAAPPLPTKRVP